MATNIGIMDSAYFVGRSEILAWINSTLQLNLSKVEEVSYSTLHHQTSIAIKKFLLPSLWFHSFFPCREIGRHVRVRCTASWWTRLIRGWCRCTRSTSTPRASTRWSKTTRSFKMSSTSSKSPRSPHKYSISLFLTRVSSLLFMRLLSCLCGLVFFWVFSTLRSANSWRGGRWIIWSSCNGWNDTAIPSMLEPISNSFLAVN